MLLDDAGFSHLSCYGGVIPTPNMDRLAAGGLRFTGFHTTALCSPTRASLLTGRNHHTVGMRGIAHWDSGFPHLTGAVTPEAATIAEILQGAGFATIAAGKWRLAPVRDSSPAGPFRHWPLGRGFDRYYGFLLGETDQCHPELCQDNHFIDPPATAAEGYHLSADIVDQAMQMMRNSISAVPERPILSYVAFGAMHAPHQAPDEYLLRWRGKFDAEATRYGVYPLDDRGVELLLPADRKGTPGGSRTSYVYLPPIDHLSTESYPQLGARSWEMRLDITRASESDQGALLAVGNPNSGHVAYIIDNRLVYDVNFFGEHQIVRSAELPSGRHVLGVHLERVGSGAGHLRFSVDGTALAGGATIANFAWWISTYGLDLGRNPTSISPDYEGPFAFSGTLHRVEIDVREPTDAAAAQDEARIAARVEAGTD